MHNPHYCLVSSLKKVIKCGGGLIGRQDVEKSRTQGSELFLNSAMILVDKLKEATDVQDEKEDTR